MRVIFIEPLLKNQQGHIFFHLRAMTSELKKRGIAYLIFGNLCADTASLRIDNFYPCFSEITVAILKLGISLKSLLLFPKLILRFKHQLYSALISNPKFLVQENDMFFCLSPHIFEFAVIGWFLHAQGRAIARKGCKVVIGFNFPYYRDSRLLTLFLAGAYKAICGYLMDRVPVKVIYFSSAELTAKEFERLLRKRVLFLPSPIYPLPVSAAASLTDSAATPATDGKVRVSYLGGARYNKGFDLYVRMIEYFIKDRALDDKIIFLTQVDIHEQQSGYDIEAVKRHVNLLESLSGKWAQVKIIYGTLPYPDYYKLLLSSDIVVLPYRDRIYQHGSSNVFMETIIAGRVPIVPAGTGIAKELSRYLLNDLVFKNGDPQDLARVVRRAVSGYPSYRERINRAREDFIRVHNADNLINTLLEL